MEEEGKTFHELHVLKTNDDLLDIVCGTDDPTGPCHSCG